jgi:hypothetical protein
MKVGKLQVCKPVYEGKNVPRTGCLLGFNPPQVLQLSLYSTSMDA